MIRFENVTKNYKSSVTALRGVSLDVDKGEFVFLVGPSGSGKTTFLRLLLREEVPDEGKIWVAGREIGELSQWRVPYLRRNLGCVFQDFRLLPTKTVFENVAFALEVIGRSKGVIRSQVGTVLELVGLGEKAARKPDELSGGEQQRVAIARAFVNRPLVLLADEPTGNLDPATSQGIMRLLDRINRTGTTVLMATHDVSMVNLMRRRVIELDHGSVVRDQSRGVYGYAGDLSNTGTMQRVAAPAYDDPENAEFEDNEFVPARARVRSRARGAVVVGVSVDYVAKETAQNLWRNRVMALAAILTVAVSLSLVGTALLLRQAVKRQIGEWSNNVSLQVFMDPGATGGQIQSARSLLQQTPQVTSFAYLDHQQSYNQAKEILAATPTALAALTPSTTPTVFRCQLKNPSDAQTVAVLFNNGVPGVYHATYPGQSIRVMQKVTSVLQIILVVIAIVLLISSLVLILNVIRMAIFARRREVGVMKLVGATNWFIRIPFMLEGLVQGFFGAVVAVFVVLLANLGVSYLVAHYKVQVLSSSVLSARDLFFTELVVVGIGVLIGVVGSFVAIRRFLEV